ncbi:MAG TPA: hypothetical protein VF116_01315 [Ktedonobacterales bacterium]
MVRALLIVSISTLLVLGVAIAGQALVVLLGVSYTPSGLPVDPTPLAVVVSIMASAGGLLSLPLVLATCVLGLVAAALRRQYTWIVAIAGVGLLALVGLVGTAWMILSTNSPVALVTPLALVAMVTLLYGLRSSSMAAHGHGRGTALEV